MLTRNFYSVLYACMAGDYPTIGEAYDGTKGKTISPNFGVTNAMKRGFITAIANSDSSTGVAFGSGTTPATPNDYTLETQITSKMTISNPNKALANITEEYIEITSTFGISATEDKVISEIGLFTNNNGNTLMLDRTVLETPIVIPAGQSKQVTYTIRMNYPTA